MRLARGSGRDGATVVEALLNWAAVRKAVRAACLPSDHAATRLEKCDRAGAAGVAESGDPPGCRCHYFDLPELQRLQLLRQQVSKRKTD